MLARDPQPKQAKRRAFRATCGALAFVVPAMIGTARAEEPVGCDGFKWPLKREAELLQAPNKPTIAAAGTAKVDDKAYRIGLVDFEAAHLPQPPERKPKYSPSKAAYLNFAAPGGAGSVQITISQAAWVDVVQNGHTVKPTMFSGARECPGVRKSIRFPLAAAPFTVQISGTSEPSIDLIATSLKP